MKRLGYLSIILVLILVYLFTRGAKNPIQPAPTNNGISYTEEFKYLPSYNGVKSTEYTPASTKEPLAKAKYIIQDTTDTKVYEEYEAILKKDGWTITQEQKVASFSAEKETHKANILVQISDKNVLLIVQSK